MSHTRILQLTDLHLFCDETSTLKGIPTRRTLRDVVEFIQQNEAPFDHVVITGDHTHDELTESYTTVRDILTPWLDRLSIVPGNHDDRNVMRAVLRDVIERQSSPDVPDDDRITFSFRCGPWQCLGLDTHLPGEVPGQLGSVQADWLRRRLTDHGSDPAILFFHHPPVDVGSVWMDAIGLQDRQLLLDVVSDFPGVKLICCGHVHHEFEGTTGSARVVTSPSTGLQFDPRGTAATFASDAPGYRVIELTEDLVETHIARLPVATYTPSND